jgi:hypothetical protein
VSQQLLADLGARFSEIEGPLTALSSMVLVQLLESQKTLLTWCRGTLDDELASHAREERLRDLTKTLMASSMELLKAQRAHRDAIMKIQSEILGTCAEAVDGVLTRVKEKVESKAQKRTEKKKA